MAEQTELAIEKPGVPSVADSIREALKESTADTHSAEDAPASPPEPSADAQETSSTPDERPRGPDGKFASKDVRADVKLHFQAKTAAPAAGAPDTAIKPFDHWSQQDKDMFSKLPNDDYRKWWLNTRKAMEDSHSKSMQEVASWKRATEPYNDYIKGFNTTPEQAVSYLMNTERVLRYGSPEQKAQMLQTLINDYQIPLPNGAPQPHAQPAAKPAEGEHWDPTVNALLQKIGQFESVLTSRQQQEQQAEDQRVKTAVSAFVSEVDDAGKPKRPHMAAVAEDVKLLILAERAAGRKPTPDSLQDLYEQACYKNPQVRELMLAERDAQAAATRQSEAAARATRARTAGVSVSGAPIGGGASDVPADSVREEVKRSFAKARGRV